MRRLREFWSDESGTTAIEYSVIATLVSIAVIGGVTQIGRNIQKLFLQPIATNLS